MHKDWKKANETLSAALGDYRDEAPDVSGAFSDLAKSAMAPGALTAKTKELISLAIGIADRCDGCIGFHTEACIKLGATEEEILETIGVAIYMGGGPSFVYGAQALEAYKQLAEE